MKELQTQLEASLDERERKRTTRAAPRRETPPRTEAAHTAAPVRETPTPTPVTNNGQSAPAIPPTAGPGPDARVEALESQVAALSSLGEQAMGQLHVLSGGARDAAKQLADAERTTRMIAVTSLVVAAGAAIAVGVTAYQAYQAKKTAQGYLRYLPVGVGALTGVGVGAKFGAKYGVAAGAASAGATLLLRR